MECLTVSCNRFYVGTEAAIRCDRGYRLLGNSRMRCQVQIERKPSWSSPVPKCVLSKIIDLYFILDANSFMHISIYIYIVFLNTKLIHRHTITIKLNCDYIFIIIIFKMQISFVRYS